jgi:hypothetical protein
MPNDDRVTAGSEVARVDAGEHKMQDFIFARELSEVYLLLDHVSANANKTLADLDFKLDPNSKVTWIEQICQIAWPPQGTEQERAKQAAALILVRDKLNTVARPANGATIAFTVLVAGEDGDQPPLWRRLGYGRSREVVGVQPAPRPGIGWGADAPSRTSLARLAYPGLVANAARFRRHYKMLLALLALWLVFTCVLSWNITTGHAINLRLQALDTQKTDIEKKIAEAQTAGAAGGQAIVGSTKPQPVTHYCASEDQFSTVAQLQLCDQLTSNRRQYFAASEDLADWLAIWGWLKGISHRLCGSSNCLEPHASIPQDGQAELNQQWAAVLADVLGNAILPVVYGILGAGAAIVRDIWGKMRDSLLSPRDMTLALAQLALGAVIGACIGLFVTPSGSTGASTPGLTGTVTLTTSALSFVAGFGVEGVFVALEGFIKRVFNVGAPASKA